MDPVGIIIIGIFFLLMLAAIILPKMQRRNRPRN